MLSAHNASSITMKYIKDAPTIEEYIDGLHCSLLLSFRVRRVIVLNSLLVLSVDLGLKVFQVPYSFSFYLLKVE